MPSIESLGYPLGYKATYNTTWPADLDEDGITMRTEVRAFDGMQKEALVYYTPSKTVWRMVSDEGPYLNGTDLAPFPLAYYTAGMGFSFVAEVLKHAAAQNIAIDDIELVQDNFYSMQGSALRGDMIGGCIPAELLLNIQSTADRATIEAIVEAATQSSAPQAYMRNVLTNVFSLSHNGQEVEATEINVSDTPKNDPLNHFDSAIPQDEADRADLVTKLASAETVFNAEGGAGSSLKSEQKRTLHIRGIVTRRDDGLLEINIQLFKPIGSTFQMLCDIENGETENAIAPPPLAFLSAGVGFCFMTQAGRYATIVKQNLAAYRIVQDNAFQFVDGVAQASPMDTHLFIDSDETLVATQKVLSMSERTCFLHAAMREERPSVVTIKLNGEE